MEQDKELIQVYVKSIYTSQNNNNYRVIELGETNGNRVMKVVLGMFEADFIAAALNNKIFKRPMPYSVMNDIFKMYKIDLREIIIFGAKEHVIFSKIVLIQDSNKQEITTRISDALALAIETGAPIYVEKYIVEQFFQNLVANPNEILINKMPIQDMSLAELNEELRIAVEDEAYEEAAKIRDEINRRREDGTTGEATNIPPDFPF